MLPCVMSKWPRGVICSASFKPMVTAPGTRARMISKVSFGEAVEVRCLPPEGSIQHVNFRFSESKSVLWNKKQPLTLLFRFQSPFEVLSSLPVLAGELHDGGPNDNNEPLISVILKYSSLLLATASV